MDLTNRHAFPEGGRLVWNPEELEPEPMSDDELQDQLENDLWLCTQHLPARMLADLMEEANDTRLELLDRLTETGVLNRERLHLLQFDPEIEAQLVDELEL